MAEKQTIRYDPQWNNMIVDDVVSQTNNVVGNFNYPPNVPAYKPIMKFLLNCPLNKAFTNCPSVVYQNFLREYWSTVVAFDPFPSTDEPEKCPLREFLIKFSVLNGQRPLTFDFKTFCSTTRLDYNNGKYVAHPTPEDPSKFTDIELTAYMIAVNNLRDSVSPPPLAPKLKKGKSQTVTPTLPKSQGPEASGALFKKRKKPKSKKPPTETKLTPPKPTEDSKGNKQPLDRDITSMTPDEGTAKITPCLEGSLGDKDSGGNIPPADMEPIHTLVADLSGTGAKYQVDETQSTRLSLPDDELDKESDEEEVLAAGDDMNEDPQDDEEVRTPSPGPTQPDPYHVQESASDSSSLDLKKFDNILPLTKRQLIKYLRKMSRFLFNQITKKQWEQHEEAAVSFADLKASIDQYYDENIAHRDQTDKLMEASMSSLDRSSTTISDLYKGLDVITQLFKDINNVVKDDPVTNQKLNEATETFARISSKLTEVLSLVYVFDFSVLLSTMKDLQAHALKQEESSAAWTKSSTNMAWNLGLRMTAVEISQTALKSEVSSLRKDTSEIKSMMVEIYQAFKGQPSSTPSGSVTPTLTLTHIPTNVEGENATTTATEEPPFSH
ncbi:hypothetical protein Tco_0271688 [Tanacetum coccineum]